jgi:hypothetical protein
MSEVSKDYLHLMAKGITHAYFDLNPPITRGDDWWAMRVDVEGHEDGVACIGRCSGAAESLAQTSLPGANFVFQAGNVPYMISMLGQVLDAQMERNHLHYDKMSQYQEDN